MGKIPEAIHCDSEENLDYYLTEVRDGLAFRETEDTWEKLLQSIQRLHSLVRGGACEFPSVLVPALKDLSQPIIQCMSTERSRLSGATVECMASLAEGLSRQFEPLVPVYFPTLLSMTTKSNKVFVGRARGCILAIIEYAQLPSLIPHLRRAIGDKSKSLRLVATDATLACLKCFNPPDLEVNARAEDIETIIRSTARDADADVRKSSRQVFDAYCMILPGRVDAFVGPLTPVVRKYLEIKATKQPKPQQNAAPPRITRPTHFLSSSTASTTSTSVLPKAGKTEFDPAQSQRMTSRKPSVSSTLGSSRGQAQVRAGTTLDVKSVAIHPSAEQKNATIAFRPERGDMSAPSRATRIPADLTTTALAARATDKAQIHLEPRRAVIMGSNVGAQRLPNERMNQIRPNNDTCPEYERPRSQASSRPSSRTDMVMTSATGMKPARPVSIRERLMGNARRQQQLPLPPPPPSQGTTAAAASSKRAAKGDDKKPKRIEKKDEGGLDGGPSRPTSSQARLVESRPKPMLSRSTDRAVSNANKLPKRHDNKISEAILVENPSQVVLPVRPKSADRVSPDLVKHAKIHLGKSTEGSRPTNELVQDGVSKTKPSTIAKAHPERPKVKPVIVTPRKARTATNRGVQPLNIRKAMKTRAAAVAAAKAFPTQATTCANTSDAEELCEENPHDHLQGEQCIPSRTSQKTRENDLVACDPAQVPLPASPVMSANDSPGTDEGCMNDGGGSVLKSVHPSTPKKERKRMATVTPITRLAEQIRQGFDFTVCIDETLPYAPGDSDEAENELASVDFCGATTNSRKGAAEGRRVLCESNS